MAVSRRTVLAAAATPIVGCRWSSASQVRYVTPSGAGDGQSWETAANLADLGTLIQRAAPGAEVRIAADAGEYRCAETIEITAGGGQNSPVRICGVSRETGEPLNAVLRGDRSASGIGLEGIRLLRGADHLAFLNLDFRDFGNGCFHVAAPVSDLTIEDCVFDNVYRFLENTAESGQASLVQFAVRRCRGARVERGFLRLRYRTRSGVVEDCAAQGMPNEGGSIPAGCALDDSASDIVFRRCVMENFQQWHSGAYWNGDGFSDEPGNKDIRYEDCEARGSTDGGFDCKSRDVTLTGCVAEDNKRNFRVWDARASLIGCTSRTPNFRGAAFENADACHIWIGAENARVRIDGLTIDDDGATRILEFDQQGAEAELRSVTIHSRQMNWGDVSLTTNGEVTTARPS